MRLSFTDAHVDSWQMPPPFQRRLIHRIDALAHTPHQLSKPLVNLKGLRSSRVGSLRIIFEVHEKTKPIHVYTIDPRGRVYRGL